MASKPWWAELSESLTSVVENESEQKCRENLAQLFRPDVALRPLTPDPLSCPNCGRSESSLRSPYCSSECREVAAFVRQFRTHLADGTMLLAERQVAVGQVLWNLLGGGYPLRQTLLTPKALEKVIARNEGRCSSCAAPATQVDHIATACNRPINLRPVCEACAVTRPFGSPELLSRPKVIELLDELATRIAAPEPCRLCDDASTWDWRAYVAARRPPNPKDVAPKD